MSPTLYYISGSPPVRSVLLTAKAIGLDLNLKLVNIIQGEHKTPEFTKLNPLQTVPVMDDEGFIICDSHAIIVYLVEKYAEGNSLYPKDVKTRATINERLHYDSGTLFPRLRALTVNIVVHNQKILPQEKLDDIKEAFSKLEIFLENNQFFAGNQLTIADFSIVATVTTLMFFVPINVSNYPILYAWLKRMESLPYYNEANQKGVDNFNQLMKSKLA